ncbi:MAG TPA: hypothetical protein VNE63_06370 [Candidatus Acidoferrales bacterium]|nr:hypothetical protein [Candidatus Acidoferrales bacterium]
MLKRWMMCSVALLFVAGLTLAGQAERAKSGSWSGVVTDNLCGAKNEGASAAACTKMCVSQKGAKLALYDSASKQVYILDPQSKATGHEGHDVTVKGTLDKDTNTIHVTSLTMNKANGM